MRAFTLMLVGLLTTIIIYLAMGTTLTLTTSNLLGVVNQSGGNYLLINGIYDIINIAFPIIIVLFALGSVITYLLRAHEREFEEYETRR